MRNILVYVGLDVHQDSIVVATARSGRSAAVVVATLPNDSVKVLKCLACLGRPEQLRVCYEAGPTGDLARRLNLGDRLCGMIAPR